MRKYILLLITAISFGQASNQMVTFTQAQGLGFALNAGQAHVASNQCMTKSEILAKYNVTISGYASNQLVPRSAWVNAVTYYTYAIAKGTIASGSQNATCTSSDSQFYVFSNSSVIQIPMTFYSDTDLITPFTGGGTIHYYATGDQLLTINNSGSLTAITGCSAGDTTPPSAPTGLSATQISASEVSLSWTASTDNVAVAQYYVYQSTDGASGNYTYIGSTTGTSIIVGGLSPATQYWYTVKAIDTSNNISGASNSAEVYMFN